jgi:peptidoglycan lytic transglycosylase
LTIRRHQGRSFWRPAFAGGLAVALLGLSGCRHHRNAQLPPPQALPPAYAPPSARIPATPTPPLGVNAADLEYVETHQPILSEVGYATWYTAPDGRRTANGEPFDNYAMTAANRTLPMGSLVTVTNLETGQMGVLRITDRGPFVRGRIVDLTPAAAKVTGVYRAGIVRVRLNVYKTPKPIETGGRWCVQIGAFHDQRVAIRYEKRLQRRYPRADVIEFSGERSYWVRIRPEGDSRAMAVYLAQNLEPPEGHAFLTRLD